MPKRIYVGRDVEETARKSGIPVDTLRKAQQGQIELSPPQLEKLERALGGARPGGTPRRPA